MDTAFFVAWIEEIAHVIADQRDHLTKLDAAIGDADHGANLDRGFSAAREALASADPPPATPGDVLTLTGTTLIRKVGGASGPLYGSAFRQMGKTLGDAPEVTPAALAMALEAGLAVVQRLGAAEEGDKTMVDALAPAIRTLTAALEDTPADGSYGPVLEDAARAAAEGAHATIPLLARKGRASYLGPRSIGHEDPGAASTALILAALSTTAAATAAK
ncbi:dihydroxyacetone kinase-like protein [Thermocatellispora tengchongensis]|uniref:Dihydroxyacetone kinase-like protein n=1 Tax=Thermocatellispora tengchongensis TaxID=1073253 RepID=A0A840P069_9ACTN|nr:dihydroxyacetone kinase subunit DhaL [Thermocatellispora tengchongensis]MBB5131856.1 dihydroxyacetone kinase-like protein [Thermocatellispora tengchongensis]